MQVKGRITLTASHSYSTPFSFSLAGDFNFRIVSPNDCQTTTFRDLLESAGLKQRVTGPTHRSGHTLDLVIDRQEDQVLSSFSVISDLLSDHSVIMCYVAFARPKPSKSHFWHRRLRDMDIDAFKSDIAKLLPSTDLHDPGPNVLVGLYNSVPRDTLDKHAPVILHSITLRPHAPWFTEELRDAKRKRPRCERAYRKSRLPVHEQIYRDQCRSYATLPRNQKLTLHLLKWL